MSDIESILKYCKENAHQWAMVNVADIHYSDDVIAACKQNSCGRYNKFWTCPPAVPTSVVNRSKLYNHALVFTTKHALEDSFDYEGMMAGSVEHSKLDSHILGIISKRDEMMILGCSHCSRCGKCSYPDSPCKFPDSLIYSVESLSIDVVNLAKKCEINYTNGANTVTYFSLFLFD